MASENPQPARRDADREDRVASLLRRAAERERAPEALHARIAALRAAPAGTAPAGAAPGARPRRGPLLGLAGAAASAAAALAVALALVIGGGAASPTLAQAAALAGRGSVAAAPGPDPRAPAKLLSAHVGNLHFPNWRAHGGWRAVGRRRDELGNRTATTVYYETAGRRIAYSIVSAPAIPGLRTHGEPYATIWRGGRTFVIWEQRAHTCLLSGHGISAQSLWRLASSAGHA